MAMWFNVWIGLLCLLLALSVLSHLNKTETVMVESQNVGICVVLKRTIKAIEWNPMQIPNLTTAGVFGQNELDTHADTCCAEQIGSTWMEQTRYARLAHFWIRTTRSKRYPLHDAARFGPHRSLEMNTYSLVSRCSGLECKWITPSLT